MVAQLLPPQKVDPPNRLQLAKKQEGLVTYLLPYLAWASLELGDDGAAAEQLDECLTRATTENIRLAQVTRCGCG